MASHKYASKTHKDNQYFQKSIRKYGWDAFVWEVVDVQGTN